MSSEDVCRLCLAIDVSVTALAGSPLQEVYEKLTSISLNTVHKPVAACSFCYWQLRKCHKLMTRSLWVDSLLTKILQTGATINRESISMIDRRSYKLDNYLSISPMELNNFIKPEPNIKIEVKDEPLSWLNERDMEREQIACSGNIKLEKTEDLEYVGAEGLEDVNDGNDVMNYQLSDIVNEETDGVEYIKDEIDIEEMKLEVLEHTDETREGESSGIKCTALLTQGTSTTQLHNCTAARHTDGDEDQDISVHNETPFVCVVCNMRFSLRRHLKTHSRVHRVKKSFECNICQRQLKHKMGLENHLRTHTGEKPFECEICHKSYKQKPDLNKHLRTHTGEKPFECEICKKRFNQRSTLNIHSRTHYGTKQFECGTCKRKYKHKTSLIIHMRSHSGEKPFQCAICDARFIRRCDLTVHLRIHSGEKPFQCKICNKRFNQRSTLMGHLKTHSKKHADPHSVE